MNNSAINSYAIVGFGCAGYHAAKAIRQYDKTGEIHIFEATNEPPANPMLTTYYVADKLSYQGAFPFGLTDDIINVLNLQFHAQATVKTVHTANKCIELENGQKLTFNKILIATGARALLPPLKGLPDQRVFVMRTMDDAKRLKQYLATQTVKKAVVVGASMVGIKVAELLNDRNIKTTIADFAGYLFPLAAFEEVGREIEQRVHAKGIEFKWNTGIEEITPAGAKFSDGETLTADVICLCIGTRANVELIGNTEIIQHQGVKINRAIVVNNRMQTTMPDIYAAGDCCEGHNLQSNETMIIGLWANAAYQGETAGKNMAGIHAEYKGNIIHNITHFMDIDFIGLGDNRLVGTTHILGDIKSNNYIKAVMHQDQLQCVNILGNYQASGIIKNHLIKQLMGEKAVLSSVQKGMLIASGVDQQFIELIGWA